MSRTVERLALGNHSAKATAITAVMLTLTLGSGASWSASLPVRRWTPREGLPHERVTALRRDAHGFLWIGTWDGVGRFDGASIVRYGKRAGLRVPLANAFTEDASGTLWVATRGGGVARAVEPASGVTTGPLPLDSPATTAFECFDVGSTRESNVVVDLTVADDGTVWCVTEDGIYRGDPTGDGSLRFARVYETHERPWGAFAVADPGRPLFVDDDGVLAIDASGKISRGPPPSRQTGALRSVVRAENGVALVVYEHELWQLDPGGPATAPHWGERLAVSPGDCLFVAAARDASDRLWLGTSAGLFTLAPDDPGQPLGTQALAGFIQVLLADDDGDLWVGTRYDGLARIRPSGIETWTTEQGLPGSRVSHLLEAHDGTIVASVERAGLATLTPEGFVPVPGSASDPFDNLGPSLLEDPRDRWWFGGSDEIRVGRELRPDTAHPLDAESGLVHARPFGAIRENGRGGICFGTWDGDLAWETVPEDPPRFHRESIGGVPWSSPVLDLLRLPSGTWWLASFVEIGRWRPGVPATLLVPDDVDPKMEPRAMLADMRGRVWIGTRWDGILVTDQPGAEHPRFRRISTADGLPSDAVLALAEDRGGTIWAGTGRGLVRMDAEEGPFRVLTAADGLAADTVHALMIDRAGSLWIGTSGGVSRLDPTTVTPREIPPPVYLTSVEVAGVARAIPVRGLRHASLGDVSSHAAALRVEVVGVDPRGDARLRYQFRLEGSQPTWGPVRDSPVIHYARLGAGRYRLLARAVDPNGITSLQPASLEFRVLPPLWQRPWVLAVIVALAVTAGWIVQRVRIRRLLALESVRRQIALDLHDDVGSGLAEIAIRSELARRGATPEGADMAGRAAELARSLREAMADIVWAIDPGRDSLADLVARIRQSAHGLLVARDIAVTFDLPEERTSTSVTVAPDVRRHVLLVFKEAAANVARHAEAQHAWVSLRVDHRRLHLEIEDDGRGFDPVADVSGHGLESLQRRAALLGGRLEIASRPGEGTRIRLEVPVGGSHRRAVVWRWLRK